MFDEPNQSFDPYYGQQAPGQQQQPFAGGGYGFAQPSPAPQPSSGLFNPMAQQMPGQPFAPNMSGFDQSMLFQAGSHIVQNQASAFLNQYADKSKSWFSSTLKYYFAVDTSYVLKKLMLIWFPFVHKDWTVRYQQDAPVAPRDDMNAPDLYIPTMSFVTYLLVAGYLLG